MTTAEATMLDMGKKNTKADGGGQKQPNRRPAVTLQARVEPALGQAFKDHVATIRPRTDVQAVMELLIERYLVELGKWPGSASQEGGCQR